MANILPMIPDRQVPVSSSNTWLKEKLKPATEREFAGEMLACLTLAAPMGMTDHARIEWMNVARAKLSYLPIDILQAGCEHASKVADHPAKIVPAICVIAEPLMRSRRELLTDNRPLPPERQIEPQNVAPEEVFKILRKFGHADVAEKVANPNRKPVDRGPRRAPTREDCIAMGVDPAHLGEGK